MSWDSYIDNLIAQSQNAADKACIIGIDGGASWTSATHAKAMQLTPQEGAQIAAVFKSKQFAPLQAGGIRAEGQKYQFLRDMDEKIVLGKKKECGAITLQSSKTAIVVAHTKEGAQQGNTNKAVGIIADYLESLNM